VAGGLAGLRGKLGNRTVIVIAAVGVALVAGIVAIVSLGGSGPTPHHREGLTISTTPVTTPSPRTPTTTPDTTPTTTPDTTPTTTPSTTPTTTPAPAPSSGGGGTFPLGNNITVTPASGWTNTCSNCTDGVELVSPDNSSEVLYAGASAASTDASTELTTFIDNISQGSSPVFSSFQTSGSVNAGNLNSNPGGFTEAAYVQFSATSSNSQGTQQYVGIAGVFLNASAGFEVVELFQAVSAAGANNNIADLNAMNSSIVGS
jgi:hypothetical protein